MNGVSFRKGTSFDLHARKQPSDRTVCGEGERTLTEDNGKRKGKAKKNRNTPFSPGNFHSFRHTVGSWLIQSGYRLELIGEILGHADIKTTRNIYAHLDLTHTRDALEGMSGSRRITISARSGYKSGYMEGKI